MKNTDQNKDERLRNMDLPDETNETDPDDLVHESKDELPDVNATEQDIDDLLHKYPDDTPVNELEEIDPDDLIHEDQKDIEEDERDS